MKVTATFCPLRVTRPAMIPRLLPAAATLPPLHTSTPPSEMLTSSLLTPKSGTLSSPVAPSGTVALMVRRVLLLSRHDTLATPSGVSIAAAA